MASKSNPKGNRSWKRCETENVNKQTRKTWMTELLTFSDHMHQSLCPMKDDRMAMFKLQLLDCYYYFCGHDDEKTIYHDLTTSWELRWVYCRRKGHNSVVVAFKTPQYGSHFSHDCLLLLLLLLFMSLWFSFDTSLVTIYLIWQEL